MLHTVSIKQYDETAVLVKYDVSKLTDASTYDEFWALWKDQKYKWFNHDFRGEIMWIWIVDTNIRIDTLGERERDEKLQVEK